MSKASDPRVHPNRKYKIPKTHLIVDGRLLLAALETAEKAP